MNGVIGKENDLPWYIPEDLKRFKALTSGNVVVMGRKTFDSIYARLGKPLPNRENIVVSSQMAPQEGVYVCRSIDEAIDCAKGFGKEIFIIGGERIYEQTLDRADRLYLSHVKKEVEGDAYFPSFDGKGWEVTTREIYDAYDFVIYDRKVGA